MPVPFANAASVQERTDLKSVEKAINFAFNMNVRLCIETCFGIFHFEPLMFDFILISLKSIINQKIGLINKFNS